MKRMKHIVTIQLLGMLLLSGCIGTAPEYPAYHVAQDTDFSFIKRVAVLPLDNQSATGNADGILRQMIVNELLASGYFDVVVPGEVMSVISAQGIKSISSMTASEIKAVANALKVQAVIFGTIHAFGEVRVGDVSVPEITITLMMAEADSGYILWSVTSTTGGASFMVRHFGARTDTVSEASLKVVREAVETLGIGAGTGPVAP